MNIRDLCIDNGIDLNAIEIIAFDVFDTLIYRQVSPMQVCRMWAERMIDCYELPFSVDQLLTIRSNIGRMLKLRQVASGNDKEYLYDDFAKMLRKRIKLDCIDEADFVKNSLEIELQVEKEVTYISNDIRELFYSAKALKKVICISDFYIPQKQLCKLLALHGIVPDVIYVSTDIGLQKRSGKLYDWVLKKEKCPAEKLLMIGDNEQSDYKVPKQKCISAIHLENEAQHRKYRKFEEDIDNMRESFKKELKRNTIIHSDKPFSSVAFLMVIFIKRLYVALKKDGCKEVLFMSREGEFFKKLFDVYQERYLLPGDRIKTHYFYVSRRATLIPAVQEISPEYFEEIFKNYKNISVKAFLRNLGLENNTEIRKEFNDLLQDEEEIEDFPESEQYKRILSSTVFQRVCKKVATEQRTLFIKYLDDMNIDYRKSGLYLVDIGYSGTSQNNIFRIFNEKINIHGYYMICYDDRPERNEFALNTKKGIVFDVKNNEKRNAFTYNSAVIEMLLLASHCGVDGYKLDENCVMPVFHNNNQEIQCYERIISHVQANILQKFTRLMNGIEKGMLDENSYYNIFLKRYTQFIFNPRKEEMDMFITIPFVDNFAIYRTYETSFDVKKYGWFSMKGILKLIQTRGKCLKDQDTHWIAAALYKLNLRALNRVLYLNAGIMMNAFEYMQESVKRKRNNVNKEKGL